MSTPFLSEIKIMSFNFAPKGWALCNGQFMPINQNQALFALLGTTYGGNGQTTFALPNLKGQVPMHQGNSHLPGGTGGTESVTLTQPTMPLHVHFAQASINAGTVQTGADQVLGTVPGRLYTDPTALTTLHPSTITNVGGSQAHANMQPYLVLNFCIALQGIFPSQN